MATKNKKKRKDPQLYTYDKYECWWEDHSSDCQWKPIKEAEKDKIYITCRLAKKKIVMTQKICLYTGANNTTETVFISKFEHCPPTMRCVYEPNKKAPLIQEMLKSIEESMR